MTTLDHLTLNPPPSAEADDHAYWRAQTAKSRRIAHLTAELRMAMEEA